MWVKNTALDGLVPSHRTGWYSCTILCPWGTQVPVSQFRIDNWISSNNGVSRSTECMVGFSNRSEHEHWDVRHVPMCMSRRVSENDGDNVRVLLLFVVVPELLCILKRKNDLFSNQARLFPPWADFISLKRFLWRSRMTVSLQSIEL